MEKKTLEEPRPTNEQWLQNKLDRNIKSICPFPSVEMDKLWKIFIYKVVKWSLHHS